MSGGKDGHMERLPQTGRILTSGIAGGVGRMSDPPSRLARVVQVAAFPSARVSPLPRAPRGDGTVVPVLSMVHFW